MSKYKVGDRVRVRSDLELGAWYGMAYANEEMHKLSGEVLNIVEVVEGGKYFCEKTGNHIYWTDEMFSGLADEPIGVIAAIQKNLGVSHPNTATDRDTLDSIADILQDYMDSGRLTELDALNAINKRLAEHFIGYGAEPPELVRSMPDDSPDDAVNHPAHYNHGGIETNDIIRMLLTPEEYSGWLKGNVIKYRDRAPWKHETPEQDWAKAKVYYDKYMEDTQ